MFMALLIGAGTQFSGSVDSTEDVKMYFAREIKKLKGVSPKATHKWKKRLKSLCEYGVY